MQILVVALDLRNTILPNVLLGKRGALERGAWRGGGSCLDLQTFLLA